jgi:hypothetical protein
MTETYRGGDLPATPRPQRRGRSIAMSADEVNTFLRSERTCRVASVDGAGAPNITPLWYVWDGSWLWLNSIVRSQRWTNLVRDGRIAVVVDGGEAFNELHGVEIEGWAEVVGDVPRTATPDDHVATAEQLFGDKYGNGTFYADGRHAWLKVVPTKISSWDFRKMPAR